jgi:hypothetical protein
MPALKSIKIGIELDHQCTVHMVRPLLDTPACYLQEAMKYDEKQESISLTLSPAQRDCFDLSILGNNVLEELQ